MIRIDEIYYNIFWSWLQENRAGTRMFFCDPPGNTSPGALFNHSCNGTVENDFVFFHDQEPIHLDTFKPLFDEVKIRSGDIGGRYQDNLWVWDFPNPAGHVIISEKGKYVEDLCRQYGWQPHYYFFHGWAALDWYRGYNRSFLMTPPDQRQINRTFISPNRIIGGNRRHRLVILYHILRNGMMNNWISCPERCPVEGTHILDAAKTLTDAYPDAVEVFSGHRFPINFPGETDSPMHSNQLSLFAESADTLLYLVTETVAHGRRLHLTEKTFKPICLRMPFIIAGTCGSLAYLRSYGFKTFGDLWDESYDDEINDDQRMEKIAWVLRGLDGTNQKEKQRLFDLARETCEYNYNHFYGGGFEQILWNELTGMMCEF
jgi:hypothetical protein